MREPGEETDHAGGARDASGAPHRAEPGRPGRRDPVEEASELSFPASDPPAAQPLHPGAPGEHPDQGRER